MSRGAELVWPFVWRSTYERMRRENYTLRDALREANNEIKRHRRLLADIQSGRTDVVRILEKIEAR